MQIITNRAWAHDRVDSLLNIHVQALREDANLDAHAKNAALQALQNAASDFHGMVEEHYGELDAIAEQDRANAESRWAQTDDGA